MADPTDSDTAEPRGPRALRASDADRERVAQALHQAAGEGRLNLDELQQRLDTVYASRTYGELEPVLADLPGVAAGTVVPATAPSHRIEPHAGDDTKLVVGVMSGPARRGDWLVPRTLVAVAFMGGVTLDLREARFAAEDVTIQAFAVMGGIDIVVPDDLNVRVEGFGIMGGFDDAASGHGKGASSGPTVRITGVAFWGGVDVRRRARRVDRDT